MRHTSVHLTSITADIHIQKVIMNTNTNRVPTSIGKSGKFEEELFTEFIRLIMLIGK